MVMPSLALEWMLSRAQAFINALLLHADNVDTHLSPLQHQRIRFVFEPMHIIVELECKHNQIILSSETPRPAGLTLTATPVQFIKTLSSHSVADLHVSGDGKLAQALQRAMGNLNIDVESFLETLVGGTLAHLLFSGMGNVQKKSQSLTSHFIQDMADYCQYEIQTVASQEACDAFSKDVNTLRYAVDHLEARCAQLKRRVEAKHVS